MGRETSSEATATIQARKDRGSKRVVDKGGEKWPILDLFLRKRQQDVLRTEGGV